MNLLDDAAPVRPQLVLHLHRLDHHNAGSRRDLLSHGHLDSHDEPGHGSSDNTTYCLLTAASRERFDLLRAVVLHLCFEPLARGGDRPARAGGVGLLAGDRPGVLGEEEMNEGRAGNRGPMRLEAIAVNRHRATLDVDDVGVPAERDVVLHAASSTTTVSTCAVCGNKSNARMLLIV